MALEYNKKVMAYFLNPKNMGEIKNPSGEATIGNPVCGDLMKVMIRVGKRRTKDEEAEEYIKDIKFKTMGCAAAIATSSMVTEIAKGKTLLEALKVTNKDVADSLGGLPSVKLHCSLLAEQALRGAIDNYRKSKSAEGRMV